MFPPFQGAFIQGRDINDNILVAHEILNLFSNKKNKREFMAIKFEMGKAYDRLMWPFIRKCLFDFGFSDLGIYHDHQYVYVNEWNS